MKRINKSIICSLVAVIFICLNSGGQTQETEKSFKLSKDAKKGTLGSFKYDDTNKQYTLVFVRDLKKETIYETMKFDYDFNQISDNSESLALIDANKKYDFVGYDEEKWKDPLVVRVDAQAWGKGNVALRKGTISREWVNPSSTSTTSTSGNLVTTTTTTVSGYWKYNFNETEKFTPKIEMSISNLISPKAPGFVRKMIENQAKKIYLVGYMTDEPSMEIQTGRKFFFPHAFATAYISPKKAYSAASGDIVVVGKQVVAWDTNYISRFVALKYSAADFSEKNRNMIEFKYGSDVIYEQELSDHTIALFFAPLPKSHVKPGKPNPNPRAFTFMRIDKDANVKERIEFESPSSKWIIKTIELTDNGDLFIYGPASQKKNDDYYEEQYRPKLDNFQFMKISGGKIAFTTTTKIDEFEKKMQTPPNMKKIDSYDGKDFEYGSMVFASTGDIFINGQEAESGPKGNGTKYGNIYLFQFGPDGILKAQYGYKKVESGKESESIATINSEFENPDNKTFTWLIYEIEGSSDTKALIYPRIATIDLAKAAVSDFQQYGYNKKEEFYVDNSRPILFIDNNQKAVFFGSDKKNKEIWFGRVKLGK